MFKRMHGKLESMYVLTLLLPPRTKPLSISILRPFKPGCGVVVKFQSYYKTVNCVAMYKPDKGELTNLVLWRFATKKGTSMLISLKSRVFDYLSDY